MGKNPLFKGDFSKEAICKRWGLKEEMSNEIKISSFVKGGLVVVDTEFDTEYDNDIRKDIMRMVIDTGDSLIRQRLIDLGWTPPGEGPK